MENSNQYELNDYANDLIHYKATQLIGKYGFVPVDYEDLVQEMTLDLLQRLSKFDPSKASLNTFVALVVDRRVSTIIRYRTQQKRDYRRNGCSLDDPIEDGGPTLESVISQDECDLRAGRYTRPEPERIDMRLEISLALSDLPPDLKRLAELLTTHSISEAARKLDVPRGTLHDTRIARLRKFFEDKELRVYL